MGKIFEQLNKIYFSEKQIFVNEEKQLKELFKTLFLETIDSIFDAVYLVGKGEYNIKDIELKKIKKIKNFLKGLIENENNLKRFLSIKILNRRILRHLNLKKGAKDLESFETNVKEINKKYKNEQEQEDEYEIVFFIDESKVFKLFNSFGIEKRIFYIFIDYIQGCLRYMISIINIMNLLITHGIKPENVYYKIGNKKQYDSILNNLNIFGIKKQITPNKLIGRWGGWIDNVLLEEGTNGTIDFYIKKENISFNRSLISEYNRIFFKEGFLLKSETNKNIDRGIKMLLMKELNLNVVEELNVEGIKKINSLKELIELILFNKLLIYNYNNS